MGLHECSTWHLMAHQNSLILLFLLPKTLEFGKVWCLSFLLSRSLQWKEKITLIGNFRKCELECHQVGSFAYYWYDYMYANLLPDQFPSDLHFEQGRVIVGRMSHLSLEIWDGQQVWAGIALWLTFWARERWLWAGQAVVENLRKLREERGTQLEKPKSHLGGSSISLFVNEEFWLSLSGFQSRFGSSCSAVRATIGSGVEASRKYKYSRMSQLTPKTDRMSKDNK